jgi:hypothetical protein
VGVGAAGAAGAARVARVVAAVRAAVRVGAATRAGTAARAAAWPPRSIVLGDDGAPKIHRLYLLGTGKTFGVFLHHFVGSDAPSTFHDHPWSWGISLMLRGGYLEERRTRDDPKLVRRWPGLGRINLLRPGTFHRVELRDGRPAWTLFVHGPKNRSWGFLDALTGAFQLWSPADRR